MSSRSQTQTPKSCESQMWTLSTPVMGDCLIRKESGLVSHSHAPVKLLLPKHRLHICTNTADSILAKWPPGAVEWVTQRSRTFREFHHAQRRTFSTPSVGGAGNSRRFRASPEQLQCGSSLSAARPTRVQSELR